MEKFTASLLFVSAVTGTRTRAKVKTLESSKAEAVEKAKKTWSAHFNGVSDSAIVVSFSKLPTPKVGVSLLEKHEYVTLTVVLPEGRLNLTTSYSGEKMSGSLMRHSKARSFFHAFSNAIVNRSITIEELMKNLAEKAKKVATADELFNLSFA